MQLFVKIDVFIWKRSILCLNAIRVPEKAALVLLPYLPLPSSLWPFLLFIVFVGFFTFLPKSGESCVLFVKNEKVV